MTRNSGLTLPEYLGHLADGQLAACAKYDEPQPCGLGDRPQRSQQVLHQAALSASDESKIEISLYVQAIYAGSRTKPRLLIPRISRNYLALGLTARPVRDRSMNASALRFGLSDLFLLSALILSACASHPSTEQQQVTAYEEEFNDP